ncbi:unnamed protein product [Kuraishia capsulata CBS 1993]|uniref:UDP-N-acetylglucosamine transferase subunit ALG13 n=1 Tax=Kuraishia capsulata CBS 1993 TaxID=1382522 RepID=W6MSG8_9ASCO|nr:uncharacterized protein KUCA_T00004138001 [Kuraishia capsulata CBS 1993]CDK28157.1 unnamed protein product [Kuraishia capsulata CBS 1993]
MGKLLVVTTGATATFRPLIAATLDAKFLRGIVKLGYNRMVVQYGTEVPISRQFYENCVAQLAELKYIGVDVGSSRLEHYKLVVEGIPYDPQFVERFVKLADLVVSHGGTGSILDALRLEKKLVVVINESLMDNHQLEIAEAFSNIGVLVYASDVNELLEKVHEVENTTMAKLGPSVGGMVEKVILQEL